MKNIYQHCQYVRLSACIVITPTIKALNTVKYHTDIQPNAEKDAAKACLSLHLSNATSLETPCHGSYVLLHAH